MSENSKPHVVGTLQQPASDQQLSTSQDTINGKAFSLWRWNWDPVPCSLGIEIFKPDSEAHGAYFVNYGAATKQAQTKNLNLTTTDTCLGVLVLRVLVLRGAAGAGLTTYAAHMVIVRLSASTIQSGRRGMVVRQALWSTST
eukprot:1643844-Amphidinium_carterae.1